MSQVRFLTQPEFHAIARNKPRGVGVRRPTSFIQRDGDGRGDLTDSLLPPWKLSEEIVDRMKDTIRVDGWRWANYMAAGGPVQWAHDTLSPPIGGMRSIWKTDTALYGSIEMANTAMGETVLGLINARMLAAGSVAFIPLRWEYSTDPARSGGINFLETELVEFSIVPVPALPSALLQARSFGVDTRPLGQWAEQALDQRSEVMPRSDLIELRAAAREPPRTRAEMVASAAARKRRLVELLPPADRAARAASIKQRLVRDGVLPAQVHHAELEQQEADRRREAAAVIDHLNAVAAQW